MKEIDATVIIDDLKTHEIHLDQVEWRAKKGKHIGEFQGADVVDVNFNGESYICLLSKEKELLYFVEHVPVRKDIMKFGRQVLVWRNKEIPSFATAGFALNVFFNKLLPKYHALISDIHQTRDGMNFWLYAMRKALTVKRNLYFLNDRGEGSKLVKLESGADIEAYKSQIWGKTKEHEKTFAVISNIKLDLE